VTVFWDIENCPVPSTVDPAVVRRLSPVSSPAIEQSTAILSYVKHRELNCVSNAVLQIVPSLRSFAQEANCELKHIYAVGNLRALPPTLTQRLQVALSLQLPSSHLSLALACLVPVMEGEYRHETAHRCQLAGRAADAQIQPIGFCDPCRAIQVHP
jgi:hypothetical protein